MNIINYNEYGEYTLHSGEKTKFKIDCDGLSDDDVYNMGLMLKDKLPVDYSLVVGIPSGGSRLANVMDNFCSEKSNNILIVDDVFTTGASMEQYRGVINTKDYLQVIGAVLFARHETPNWITPLFRMY